MCMHVNQIGNSYVFLSRKRMEILLTSASETCNLRIPPERISTSETFENNKNNYPLIWAVVFTNQGKYHVSRKSIQHSYQPKKNNSTFLKRVNITYFHKPSTHQGKKAPLRIPFINGSYCFIQTPEINHFSCTTWHQNSKTIKVSNEHISRPVDLRSKYYHIHARISTQIHI